MADGDRKKWSFPAPDLLDGADEELMFVVGNILFPGSIERLSRGGLQIWVEIETAYPPGRDEANAVFQVVLGVLRARNPDSGTLKFELAPPGAVISSTGDAVVHAMTARVDVRVGNDLERFAEFARRGISQSDTLEDALWLHGRAHRTGADYYMIHELAMQQFGGPSKKALSQRMSDVDTALGVGVNAQRNLRQSACNLSPRRGGRHAGASPAPWDLQAQRTFAGDVLRRWIEWYR